MAQALHTGMHTHHHNHTTAVPAYEQLRSLQRNDIVFTRNFTTNAMSLLLIHHIEDDEVAKSVKLYGGLCSKFLDLNNPAAQQTDFFNSFVGERDAETAVAKLKSEVTPLILSRIDAIAHLELGDGLSGLMPQDAGISLFEISLGDVDAVLLEPSAGAIRKHLLGRCPFGCNSGHLPNAGTVLQIWPKFLDGMSEGVQKWFRNMPSPFCPSCMGIDFCREQVKVRAELCTQASKPAVNDPFVVGTTAPVWDRMDERKKELGYQGVQAVHPGHPAIHHTSIQPPRATSDARESLSRDAIIAKLTTAPYDVWMAVSDRVTKDVCAICKFDEYKEGDVIIALPCKHFFHKECLTLWLREKDDCPVCRIRLPQFRPNRQLPRVPPSTYAGIPSPPMPSGFHPAWFAASHGGNPVPPTVAAAVAAASQASMQATSILPTWSDLGFGLPPFPAAGAESGLHNSDDKAESGDDQS